MKTLIKFELRKICTRRQAVVGLVAVLLLSLLLNVSSYCNMHAFDGQSREGSGGAAVALDQEIAARYAGPLTDEKVRQMLADFTVRVDLHGMNAAYLYQNATQSALFKYFADQDGSWNGRTVAEVFGGAEVKIGYVNGWLTSSQNLVRVLLALALALVLALAPVFAGEYGGVDNLILTSKYGPSRACLAKIIASGLAAVLATALVLALHLGLALALYGRAGLDCSILFAPQDFGSEYIPYNISCGTLLAYQVMLAFGSALSVCGITLLFSSLCPNQLAAFSAAAAVYLLPVLLPVAENSPLFRLVALLPLYQAQFVALMAVEQLSGGLLYAVWALPVALVCFGLGTVLAWRFFAGHQLA